MAFPGGGVSGEFQPGTTAIPCTQVEISVAARDLLDKDVFSKSDPMCVLLMQEFGRDNYFEFGRTETIQDSLNPDFVRKFVVTYNFEQLQKLQFAIYDRDSPNSKLTDHDFLGRVDITLGELISAGGNVEKSLINPERRGRLILSAEELSSCKEEVVLTFIGQNLDKKDWFGKSDPFLEFKRCNEDNSFTIVHRTEYISNTLNPKWKTFRISLQQLCNGDYDRTIKIICHDWNSNGTHECIGEFTSSLRELLRGPGRENQYECINIKKKSKKSYKNSGIISLTNIQKDTPVSFLDYIHSGTEICFTVAIDFTASNGDPRQSNSLHYITQHYPNEYVQALLAVGSIIEVYDTDKLFPCLGFGARIPPDGQVSHEFAMNGQPNNPFVFGLHGIMEAYHYTLSRIQLYGPTNFAPIINHVSNIARQNCNGSRYNVLLIITDGVISDINQTKEAIVLASGLPLSIIIVGVGGADFSAMDELDGDDVRVSSRGRYAERDIVQFVPFRKYQQFSQTGNSMMTQAKLAQDVLAEVPDQLISWMKKAGIQPRPPPQVNQQPQLNPQNSFSSQPGPPPQAGVDYQLPYPSQPTPGSYNQQQTFQNQQHAPGFPSASAPPPSYAP